MAYCNFCDRCFFFNEQLIDNLLSNAEWIREKYCAENFTRCTIYKIATTYGIGKVRGSVFPGDFLENLNNSPPETCPHVGDEMLTKVIYADGSLSTVKYSQLGKLIRMGKIAAYQSVEEWVEVRRKRKIDYKGRERRANAHF